MLDEKKVKRLTNKLWSECLTPAGIEHRNYRRDSIQIYNSDENSNWYCLSSPNKFIAFKRIPFNVDGYQAELAFRNRYHCNSVVEDIDVIIYKYKDSGAPIVSEFCRVRYKGLLRG